MPPPSTVKAPPPPDAVFPATVSSTRDAVDSNTSPPPRARVVSPEPTDLAIARFSATVEFLSVAERASMPPASARASWPEPMVLAVTEFREIVDELDLTSFSCTPPLIAWASPSVATAVSAFRFKVDRRMMRVVP